MTKPEELIADWRTFVSEAAKVEKDLVAAEGVPTVAIQTHMAYVLGLSMGLCDRAGVNLRARVKAWAEQQ